MQDGFAGHFEPLQLCLLQSLGLCSSVLEPDLHLCLRQAERAGKFSAFCDRQILLLTELPFEGQELSSGERCSGFTVRLVLPESACCGTRRSCKISS